MLCTLNGARAKTNVTHTNTSMRMHMLGLGPTECHGILPAGSTPTLDFALNLVPRQHVCQRLHTHTALALALGWEHFGVPL